MKWLKQILLFITFLFLSGCLKQDILDDVQLATAVGYDIGENNRLEVTAVVPMYQPDKSVKNKTFTATSELSKEVRDELNTQSNKPVVSGKISTALYSVDLAKRGLIDIIDTFLRDPSTGSQIYLGVVEGNVKEQLQVQYGNMDNGMYLSRLIEHNIEGGMLPKTNLHRFTKAYYSEGKDGILPYLKLEGKVASITGIALFQEDKFFDSIHGDDTFIFKLLHEKFTTNASFTVKLDGSELVSIYNITSNRKYKVNSPMDEPKIRIEVETEAVIREYTGERMDNQKMKLVEKKLEEQIKDRGEALIKGFQEDHIDPLGIGNHVKSSTRKWDKEKWETLYPTAKIEVYADVTISESGIIR